MYIYKKYERTYVPVYLWKKNKILKFVIKFMFIKQMVHMPLICLPLVYRLINV